MAQDKSEQVGAGKAKTLITTGCLSAKVSAGARKHKRVKKKMAGTGRLKWEKIACGQTQVRQENPTQSWIITARTAPRTLQLKVRCV